MTTNRSKIGHIIVENARQVLRQKNSVGNWSGVPKRLDTIARLEINAGFQFGADAKVYTVGSCFARNIEEHLDQIGCRLPTLDFWVPQREWPGLRSNGILNKYTPAAICSDFEWAAKIYERDDHFRPSDAAQFAFQTDKGLFIDLQLGGYTPVSNDRLIERRQEVYSLLREAFSADCVTITLGLTEAWKLGDMYVQQPPATHDLLRHADRFSFELLDYETCRALIQRSVDILKKHNPEVKILVTISPVPLQRTFTNDDIIVANMSSKSTLRAVADTISKMNKGVDYFPSYEFVMMSKAELVYAEDRRHVRNEVVGRIVQSLVEAYVLDVPNKHTLFQKASAELSSDNPDLTALQKLLEVDHDLSTLSIRQLTVLLRSSWRVRSNKSICQATAQEIMRRPQRNHATLRSVNHIFPRIGLSGEAISYANDVLNADPDNSLARRILDREVKAL